MLQGAVENKNVVGYEHFLKTAICHDSA